MRVQSVLWEEKFVRAVTVTLKREEEVAFKVKAQFASEDTMRDVLKLKEFLGSKTLSNKQLLNVVFWDGCNILYKVLFTGGEVVVESWLWQL